MTDLIVPPPRGFSIALIDPPWAFSDRQKNRPENYARMDNRSLRDLPVASIMAADSVMFMWSTNTHLPIALRVMGAWSFDFRTIAFCWSKRAGNGNPAMGMGHYTRQSVELCLLGVRGRGLERRSASVHQLIESVPGEHSEKPAETRTRIVELFGDVPRVELFATSQCDGWGFWGPRNHRTTRESAQR